ncbi:Uncharacterised protein g7524 [Pycnogonum litorale]
MIFQTDTTVVHGTLVHLQMDSFPHILTLVIFGLLTTFIYAAEDKPMNKDDFKAVEKTTLKKADNMARSYYDNDEEYDDVNDEVYDDEEYDKGSCNGDTVMFIVGMALLSSVVGAFFSSFISPIISNGNNGVVSAPTAGTVTVGTTSVLPTTGRKKRSLEFYKHPYWNRMSDVLHSLSKAVQEYENIH